MPIHRQSIVYLDWDDSTIRSQAARLAIPVWSYSCIVLEWSESLLLVCGALFGPGSIYLPVPCASTVDADS